MKMLNVIDMIEEEKDIWDLNKIEMGRMIEMALKSIQHESDADYVDPLILQEEYEESIREERFYNLLTNDEKERWEVIRKLFVSLENDRKGQYLYHLEMESEFLDSYFENTGLDTNGRRAYLKATEAKYIEIIARYPFGRELLDNFTIEKFLCLFNEIEEYRPKDIKIKGEFEKKSEAEIKEDLIEYGAKLKAVLSKLAMTSNSGLEDTTKLDSINNLSIQSIDIEKKKPKKPGRKPTIVNGDFSLKNVASTDQINALNNLLIDNFYIEEINGKYYRKKSKSIKKFATIIKALNEYGYSSGFIDEQAFLILKNDYNVITTVNTVTQANDDTALYILKAKPYPPNS